MGKLASAGGLVTRDNEERKASAWLVGRGGASYGRALLAVSIGRRRRRLAREGGGDVLVVPRSGPIERNDFSTGGGRSHHAFTAPPRISDDGRAIHRATTIETAVSCEEGLLVRLGVCPPVSSQVRQELCSTDDDVAVVEPGNERRYRWRYLERGVSLAEDPIDQRSGIEASQTELCAIARGRVCARTCARVRARARTRARARVRARVRASQRRRRRSHRRCPRRCWPAGSNKLSLLFGLATIVAVAATLCATAASAVPRQSNPLSRTGLWHDLDRSTGLEDVYEDAFEDIFPEEIRPTTRTVLDETELNIIRRSIARGLGLERIPDPSKANVSQTEYERAHNEYLKRVQLLSNGETNGGEKKLHVFSATAYPGNESSRLPAEVNHGEGHCRRHRLYFPVEIPVQDRRRAAPTVDHATLRLLLHAPSTGDYYAQSSELDALLYLNTSRGSRKLIFRRRLESRDGRNSRWLEFDATVAVSSWMNAAAAAALDNLGLELEFRSAGKPVRRNFSTPFLNVFTTTSGRVKRSSPEQLMSLHNGRRTKCKGESRKCCRHELTVMFKDLKGFEFIVYPKTFDAGYCKGRCPPRYNPAHHHALLQSLLWKEDRKKVPKPCCAPSKLDQLMIVYFDENDSTQLKVSYWKNIKVLECACS